MRPGGSRPPRSAATPFSGSPPTPRSQCRPTKPQIFFTTRLAEVDAFARECCSREGFRMTALTEGSHAGMGTWGVRRALWGFGGGERTTADGGWCGAAAWK
jgi:hypothetical protein